MRVAWIDVKWSPLIVIEEVQLLAEQTVGSFIIAIIDRIPNKQVYCTHPFALKIGQLNVVLKSNVIGKEYVKNQSLKLATREMRALFHKLDLIKAVTYEFSSQQWICFSKTIHM